MQTMGLALAHFHGHEYDDIWCHARGCYNVRALPPRRSVDSSAFFAGRARNGRCNDKRRHVPKCAWDCDTCNMRGKLSFCWITTTHRCFLAGLREARTIPGESTPGVSPHTPPGSIPFTGVLVADGTPTRERERERERWRVAAFWPHVKSRAAAYRSSARSLAQRLRPGIASPHRSIVFPAGSRPPVFSPFSLPVVPPPGGGEGERLKALNERTIIEICFPAGR